MGVDIEMSHVKGAARSKTCREAGCPNTSCSSSLILGFMLLRPAPSFLLPCCIVLHAKFVFASLDMACSKGATLESSFVRGLQAAFHHGGPQAEAVVEAGGIEALIDALHRGAGRSQLQQAVCSFLAEE